MAEYTAITPDGKYLLHYGVKGMKWGKNKTKKDYKIGTRTFNPSLDVMKNYEEWKNSKANTKTGASTMYTSKGWLDKSAEESNVEKAQAKRKGGAKAQPSASKKNLEPIKKKKKNKFESHPRSTNSKR